MTREAARDAVARMATDPGFAEQVRRDPASALAGFDLTDAERESILALTGEEGGSGADPSMRMSSCGHSRPEQGGMQP